MNSPRPLSRGRLDSGLAATQVHATSTTSQGGLVPEWGGVACLSLNFCDVRTWGGDSPFTPTLKAPACRLHVLTLPIVPGPVPSSLDAFVLYSSQPPYEYELILL